MASRSKYTKVIVGSSEQKRSLAGYLVLSDVMIESERTLILERPQTTVPKAKRKGNRAPVATDTAAVVANG